MEFVCRLRFVKLCVAVVTLASLANMATTSFAQLLAYEGFDYTVGAGLNGLAGGVGWDKPGFTGWDGSQAAIGADVIQAGSLQYTDTLGNVLTTTGGKLLNTGSAGASQGGRYLAERRSTGSTWMSFLSQRIGELNTDGTYLGGANLALFDLTRDNNQERLNIGPENSNNSWLNPDTNEREDRFQLRYPNVSLQLLNSHLPEESQPPTPNFNTASNGTIAGRYRDVFTEASTHNVNLFVMRIDHIEGGGDNIYFWLNPNLNTTPSDNNVSGRYLDADIQAAALVAEVAPYGPAVGADGEQSFDRLRLFAAASAIPAELLIDEIRFGTTFASVTPHTPSIAGLPGDYNGDNIVDAADYTVWRNNLGTNFNLNGNGDETGASGGTVDAADYLWWKSHYGNTGPGSGGLAAHVPEPSSAMLVLVACVALCCGQRRSAR
jgi:hypothetical protein